MKSITRTSLAVLAAVTAGTLALGAQSAYSQSVDPNTAPQPIASSLPSALTPVMMAERDKPTAQFSAHMTGLQVVPPVTTEAAGSAVISLNPERNQAQIALRLTSFSSPVLGVVIGYGTTGAKGVFLKALNVNAAGYQNAALNNTSGVTLNNMKVGNLSTTSFNLPEGTVQVAGTRNILASPAPLSTSDALTPNPSISTQTSVTTVTPGQTTTLTLYGTQISFVEAAAPAIPSATIAWTKDDKDSPLNATVVDEMGKGRLFLTVLTQAHPEGEIRGQITNANDYMR